MSKNTRKNEAKTDISLFNFIKENRLYSNEWNVRKQTNEYIQEILDKTSKKETGRNGYPDLIYINENKKLLILVENKDHIKDHVSKNEDKPADFAVDGIKHYLSFFTDKKLSNEKETIKKYLKNWKIIGVAFSGDINDEYNHRLDTYIVKENEIQNINKNEILDENDYFAYFENIDLEKISNDISRSSSEINRLLRNLDSQKRPILLSALMICLYPKDSGADFKNSYSSWNTQTIIRNIPTTISDILESEKIDKSKIEVLTNELTFIKTDTDLTSTDILKDILKELEERVIPLFDKKTSYDIIGKFNEEFFSTNASDVLDKLQNKPTIGFVNPPYGGKDNETNPTKKEIQFLEKMLDSCSRYGIIIAPLSTYFKDDVDRNRILAKHTLKYVINMQS